MTFQARITVVSHVGLDDQRITVLSQEVHDSANTRMVHVLGVGAWDVLVAANSI